MSTGVFAPNRSLLFAVLLVASCQSPAADPDPNRFSRAIEYFSEQDRTMDTRSVSVVFVGSSSIGGWDLDASFPEFHVLNRGFGGSQLSDVNHFLDRIVIQYRPSVVVIYAGENDIHAGNSPDRVVAEFRAFVDAVHAALPETVIVYLSMKPSPDRRHLWQKMKAANDQVADMCLALYHLRCIDTASPMLQADGTPRPEIFTSDGLHMNVAGYALWNDLVREELHRLLGGSSAE